MNRDSALSSTVAFIMILSAVLVIAGVWAAVVLPVQMHAENEAAISSTISTLTDTTLLMDAARSHPGVSVATYLPQGTLRTANGGMLSMNGDLIPLRYLIFSGGGDTVLGLGASGIWRRDLDTAAWVLFPTTSYASNHLTLELFRVQGNVAYGSTDAIPLLIRYDGSVEKTISGTSVSLTPMGELWEIQLWKTCFEEAGRKYSPNLKVRFVGDTAQVSAKQGEIMVTIVEHCYSVSTRVVP